MHKCTPLHAEHLSHCIPPYYSSKPAGDSCKAKSQDLTETELSLEHQLLFHIYAKNAMKIPTQLQDNEIILTLFPPYLSSLQTFLNNPPCSLQSHDLF